MPENWGRQAAMMLRAIAFMAVLIFSTLFAGTQSPVFSHGVHGNGVAVSEAGVSVPVSQTRASVPAPETSATIPAPERITCLTGQAAAMPAAHASKPGCPSCPDCDCAYCTCGICHHSVLSGPADFPYIPTGRAFEVPLIVASSYPPYISSAEQPPKSFA